MKTNIFYLISLLSVIAFFYSCDDSEKLEPSNIDSMSRFEFPEGDSEADQIFLDIYEKFNVRIIYKNWTPKDWDKSWTTPGGGEISVITSNAGRHFINGEIDSLNIAAEFLRDHYFAHVGSKIKDVFPQYIYLVNSYAVLWHFPGPPPTVIPSYAQSKYGLDFMLLSPYGPKGGGNPALFEDNEENLYKLKALLLWSTFFNKMFDTDGGIIVPETFVDGLDTTNKLDNKNTASEDYYLTRGFIDLVSASSFGTPTLPSATKPSAYAKTPKQLFKDYFLLAMYYDEATIQEKYGSYPLVMERYNKVVSYMKDNYDIDLQAIAKR